MTSPTTTTVTVDPQRDALARELLDTVLPANYRVADELDHWLSLIAGTAGHLYCAFDASHFHQRDFIGSADQVAAIAALLEKSTRIARVLASGLRDPGIREGGQ